MLQIKYLIQFFAFLALQCLVFERFAVEGVLPAPHVFLLFLIFTPLRLFRASYFIACFTFGILLDAFVRPLGAHAFAGVLIAALRGIWIEFIKPQVSSEELQVLELETQSFGWQMSFLIPLIFIYELTYYILTDFTVNFQTIYKVLTGSVVSVFFCLIFTLLFYRKSGK